MYPIYPQSVRPASSAGSCVTVASSAGQAVCRSFKFQHPVSKVASKLPVDRTIMHRDTINTPEEKRQRACSVAGAVPYWQCAPIQAASDRFKKLCQERDITITETFYKMLHCCPDDRKEQFFDKALCYFASTDHRKTANTSSLTSMLLRSKSERTKARVINFLGVDDADIRAVASCSGLRSIAAMHNGRGFPKASDVVALLSSPILQIDGQVNESLLATISTLCHSRGLPAIADLEALLSLPDLQIAGQFNLHVLRSIASMGGSRGLQACQGLDRLLQLPCLRSGGQVDVKSLSIIARICRRKGLPDCERVASLFRLVRLHGAPTQRMMMLQCYSFLYLGKGLPTPEDQERLFLLPALWSNGRQFDHELMEAVATANRAVGFPTVAMLQEARCHKLRKNQKSLTGRADVRAVPTAWASPILVLPQRIITSQQLAVSSTTTVMNTTQCGFVPCAQQFVASASHPLSAAEATGESLDIDCDRPTEEATRRINEIMHDLVSNDLPVLPLQQAPLTLSPVESEELCWLEEIANSDKMFPPFVSGKK